MNKVKIIVYNEDYKFIKYLINNNIYYYDLECKENNYTLIIKENDYIKLSRRYKIKVIKYYGKKGIVLFFNFHKYMIISFIMSLFILYLLSNTIFEINVNTDNEEVKSIILTSLKNEGIYKYKKKKSFEELNNIKKKILSDNKDKLEWIEIIEEGVTYKVEVTPRVLFEQTKSNTKNSSIYAKKEGLIKKIVVYRGSKVKEINDYVKKGELLISGNILKDEKIVNKVNANGIVYAEVWSLVKVSVPFIIEKKEFTNKVVNHYYLDINGFKFTISGKINSNNTINDNELLISKPYLPFDIYKESIKIYKNKTYNITQNEAYEIALKTAEDKIQEKLKYDEYILSKNVLKKEVKSSKMYVEVLFKTFENIGYTSNIDIIGETDGNSN